MVTKVCSGATIFVTFHVVFTFRLGLKGKVDATLQIKVEYPMMSLSLAYSWE